MRALAVILAAIVAAPAAASAGETPRMTMRNEYYGGYIIIADAGAFGLALAAGNGYLGNDEAAVWIPLGAYVLGGPIVHLLHGQPDRAYLSGSLRGALPILGAFAAASTADCSDRAMFCGIGEAVIGGAIGMGVAMVVDWTVLGRREIEERPAGPRQTFTAMPDVSVSRDGDVRVGLLGTF